MSRSGEQVPRDAQSEAQESAMEKEVAAKLPTKSSPYVKYKDMEDYKRQGYGTEGHMEPKPGQGGGATDAPTASGSSIGQAAELATNAVGPPK